MDVEKPLDSMAKKSGESEHKDTFHKNSNNTELDNNIQEQKKKSEALKEKMSEEEIRSRIWFLKEDPNDLNQNEKKPFKFSEFLEATLWEIPEKKRLWFERTLRDGREVRVEWWEDSFSINIAKGWKTLIINLKNFENNKESTNSDTINNKSKLQVSVSWNMSLLNKDLKYPYNTKDIVESIGNIMSIERQEIHGVKDYEGKKDQERFDKKKDEYDLLLTELSKDFNSNPPATNEEIAKFIINPKNFESSWQYLSSRKAFLALCILFRNGNNINNVQEIKNKILGDNETNIQKAANTKNKEAWENIVEYLSNNPVDLRFIIDNESDIISLALKNINITQEETNFLLTNSQG